MPEDTPENIQIDFLAGIKAAWDDPCMLNADAPYWWQRGFATGVIERIERKFGYPSVRTVQ